VSDDRLHDLIQRLWRDIDQGHKLPDWTLEVPDDWDEEEDE
jgi:hypothetical protein